MESTRRQRSTYVAIGRIVVAMVSMVGVYFLLPFERSSVTQVWLVVFGAVVLLVGVSAVQLRAVAHAEFPTIRGAEALVVSLVLLLVSFAGIYVGLSSYDSASFNESLDHVAALYFALTTLTTVGFGDIAPVSDAARIVVMVQMVVNVIVIGVFIKLVVSAVKSRLSVDLEPGDPRDPQSVSVG
jgi:voltage-gated potassium channel